MTQGSRLVVRQVPPIDMHGSENNTKRSRINSSNSEGSSGSRESPAITNLAQGEFFMDQQQRSSHHENHQSHTSHGRNGRTSNSRSPDPTRAFKMSRENSGSGKSNSSSNGRNGNGNGRTSSCVKNQKDTLDVANISHANSTNSMGDQSSSPSTSQIHGRQRIKSKNSLNSREDSNQNNSSSRSNFNIPTTDENNMQTITPPFPMGRRRSSMPNVSDTSFLKIPHERESRDNKLRRVRSFKTTSKGAVVNRGDSFKKKSTHSLRSAGNSATEARQLQQQLLLQQQLQQQQQMLLQAQQEVVDDPYAVEAPPIPTFFRIIMMGGAGTGKSVLANQFMTSDYVDNVAEDNPEGTQETTVSVLLDGEESTIQVIDPVNRNVIVDGLHQLLDAYVVVFAINDHSSFQAAHELVRYLRVEYGTDRVVLLVGNKTDLVRKRKVAADEARLVAETYDCKYTETSAAMNHGVDELLVGVLTQIRLHMRLPFTTISFPGKGNPRDERENHRRTCKGPRKFFSKLFRRSGRKKLRECENLHAL